MDDLTKNGLNFTEHRDDYLPTPPQCPPSPDCPCPPPRPLPPMPPMPGCPPRPCPPDPCQNRTPNYGLPLWKASDVTSWLMQMNGAMLRIDNIMHDLALRTGINGLPDDLVTTVSKLCQDVAVLNCTVGELSNKQANQDLLMQNMNTQFSAMKTDIASLQLSITNLDTRVMTVDSANQQNRNDITLIKSDLNMLSKTVTNLSSNLTQFQNATNQTLATLQTSVDAIEGWMVNPSGNLAAVYIMNSPTVNVTNTTADATPKVFELIQSESDKYTPANIALLKVCGTVCQANITTPDSFELDIIANAPSDGSLFNKFTFTWDTPSPEYTSGSRGILYTTVLALVTSGDGNTIVGRVPISVTLQSNTIEKTEGGKLIRQLNGFSIWISVIPKDYTSLLVAGNKLTITRQTLSFLCNVPSAANAENSLPLEEYYVEDPKEVIM